MSAAAFVSLGFLIIVLLACIGPLGRYMAKVYGGESAPGDRVFLPVERLIYRVMRVNPKREQRWNVYALAVLAFSFVSVLALYLFQRVQSWLPLDNGLRQRRAEDVLQHCGQLRHQHELAVVLRRVHHGPPGPDVGPGRAELRVRGGRHGAGGRVHPWSGPAPWSDHRQLLGRPHPDDGSHTAPDRLRDRHRAVRARGGAELQELHHGDDRGQDRADPDHGRQRRHGRRAGHRAEDPRWAGGQPGSDQGPRHERRRLLQRELRPIPSRARPG